MIGPVRERILYYLIDRIKDEEYQYLNDHLM